MHGFRMLHLLSHKPSKRKYNKTGGNLLPTKKPQRWQAEPQCTQKKYYSLNDLVRRRTVECHITFVLALCSALLFLPGITSKMTVIDNEQCKNVHAPKTPTIIIIDNRKTFLLSTHLVLDERAFVRAFFAVFCLFAHLIWLPLPFSYPLPIHYIERTCSMRILRYKDLQRNEMKPNETKKPNVLIQKEKTYAVKTASTSNT